MPFLASKYLIISCVCLCKNARASVQESRCSCAGNPMSLCKNRMTILRNNKK